MTMGATAFTVIIMDITARSAPTVTGMAAGRCPLPYQIGPFKPIKYFQISTFPSKE